MSGAARMTLSSFSRSLQTLHLGNRGDQPQELPEVIDGELAGLAVVRVPAQRTERRIRRPRVEDGHADATHRVPELGQPDGGIRERVLYAVDVEEDVSARRVPHPFRDRRADPVVGRLARRDDGLILDPHPVDLDRRRGRCRKPKQFLGRRDSERHLPVPSLGQGVLDDLVPREVPPEFDHHLADGQGVRSVIPVPEGAVGARFRTAIGRVEEGDARLGLIRVGREKGILPGRQVEVRGRRQGRPAASGQPRDGREHGEASDRGPFRVTQHQAPWFGGAGPGPAQETAVATRWARKALIVPAT
jgi:hypothetical protein